MNPLLFAGSIVVGYLAASVLFPERGWASSKVKEDKDKDPQHPDRSPEMNAIKKKGAKQIIPGLPITQPKNQCPGRWVESNGIIYCDSWTHQEINELGTRKSTKVKPSQIPVIIPNHGGPQNENRIRIGSNWTPGGNV